MEKQCSTMVHWSGQELLNHFCLAQENCLWDLLSSPQPLPFDDFDWEEFDLSSPTKLLESIQAMEEIKQSADPVPACGPSDANEVLSSRVLNFYNQVCKVFQNWLPAWQEWSLLSMVLPCCGIREKKFSSQEFTLHK